DLRGFTPLSRQLDANGLITLLAEYQARLVPVIQHHRGSIDKFLGDGILASFGAVRRSDTHAADALRAVDDLMAEAQAWREDRAVRGVPVIPVGAAVASGPVLFGVVGDASRLEYTVIGEAVNLAAKLEKHTKVCGVRALAAADTYDLALRQGYAPDRPAELQGAATIAGIDRPIDLVTVAA
ncbi:MAG TPA: adenylate/guanylate cyclase domain-containing protein, partial [Gammaproteobacteria bacterium]|nr:adenylate/guanylate cyclase domain-containing protein [Gammaproteobacteria bacterium]